MCHTILFVVYHILCTMHVGGMCAACAEIENVLDQEKWSCPCSVVHSTIMQDRCKEDAIKRDINIILKKNIK